MRMFDVKVMLIKCIKFDKKNFDKKDCRECLRNICSTSRRKRKLKASSNKNEDEETAMSRTVSTYSIEENIQKKTKYSRKVEVFDDDISSTDESE
jgi:hypothetical protein